MDTRSSESQAHPRVTVILPFHNAEETLLDSLGSVLGQTLHSFELLAVDDGSTDSGPEMVRRLAREDRRIRLISRCQGGPSAARNQGIAAANGAGIAFLDADDTWLPTKLEHHDRQFCTAPEVGVGFAAVERVDHQGRVIDLLPSPERPVGVEDLLRGNCTITMSNVAVRSEVFDQVGGFDRQMSYAEDLDWLLRVAFDGSWQIRGIPQVLTRYRVSSGSLSSRLSRMELGWNRLAVAAAGRDPQRVIPLLSRAQAEQYLYLARQAAFFHRFETGAKYLRQALRQSPSLIFRAVPLVVRMLVLALGVRGQEPAKGSSPAAVGGTHHA